MEPKAAVDVISVDASDAMQNLTLTVTGYKVMSCRWAIAAAFFRMGALIAGCMIDIATSDYDFDDGAAVPPSSRSERG